MSRLSVEFFGQKRAVSREVFDSIRRLATSSYRKRRYKQSLGWVSSREQTLDFAGGDYPIPIPASILTQLVITQKGLKTHSILCPPVANRPSPPIPRPSPSCVATVEQFGRWRVALKSSH